MLFGRHAELAAVDRALDGATRLLVLGGPAGIGKSALAAELVARARARGSRVGQGRAFELGGAPPFWPWIEAIEALGRDCDSDEGLMLASDLLRPASEEGGRTGDALRFSQFEAVRRALLDAADRGRLVIVLEDVH